MSASNDRKWEMLFCKARMAGLEAGNGKVPVPMVVSQHANMADDASPVENQWYVPSGVCGFAWVNIRPGNHPFANWLKKSGHAHGRSYYGGVDYWVGDYGQSMEKKMAFACAFARVLNEAGVSAHPMDRMD